MPSSTSLSAVLIDVGDTMARADPSWRDVYASVFERHGITATPDEFEAAFRAAWAEWVVESPFEATEEASFGRLSELDQLVFDRLGYHDLPEAFFRDVDLAFRSGSAFHVFEDVIPALEAMRGAGLRLGVVSNWGWHAPELLETLGLASYFEILSISARVGYQKPHAAIFEHALLGLGVGPDAAVHVGDDRKADVDGARALGIGAVLIDRRRRYDPNDVPESTTLVRDFGELLDELEIERPSTLARGAD